MYVGSEGGVERDLAARAGVPFVGVPSGGLHGVGLWNALRNSLKLARGWLLAYRLGKSCRPGAAFVTGGYASVPVALAARTLGVPVMVYLPDIEPGFAVRFIARFATAVAVTVADSAAFFKGRDVFVSGYPLRSEFAPMARREARELLRLQPDVPVVLVLGGSRGSQSLNQALGNILDELLEVTQVVHVTGYADWECTSERLKDLSPTHGARYLAVPYLHGGIATALAAADLVVSRSGASTLGELPACGVPAILVPYAHAWRYQRVNADWLAERGAAIVIDDADLHHQLGRAIRDLLRDRPRLAEMAGKMASLAQQDAAAHLAQLVCAMAR
jgi:UDP-N-acetylglucosamine--N-acetylmuramyl-(pentapeptide) pyrophosphoryl-undecaprenol N-acetylglucosamine transferase